MTNRTIAEIHALETTASANLNRDDTGSPKTVEYGGVTRARVSSQAWKRPTRLMFRELLGEQDLGVRTKHVVDKLRTAIDNLDVALADDSEKMAETVLETGAGIKLTAPRKKKNANNEDEEKARQSTYLLFLGNRQYDRLAQFAVNAWREVGDQKAFEAAIKAHKKDIKKIVQDDKAIDVALFGRMVADDTDLNVDAAAQVAHAISVQAVDTESDYYTAVDDAKNDFHDENEGGDQGAAMLGEIEFNAATFYRYANVDANRLNDTLGDPKTTAKAVGTFIRAFVTSMPQGKINSFAQGTLPELVIVNIRDTQAVNLVGAFERPVRPDYVEHATEALVEREQQIDEAYGTAPIATWVIRIGDNTKAANLLAEPTNLKALIDDVEHVVEQRLAGE